MTAPMMPIKREPWRPPPQGDKQGTDDFNHSDQIRNALKAEDSIEPEHQRTVRQQGLPCASAAVNSRTPISNSVIRSPKLPDESSNRVMNVWKSLWSHPGNGSREKSESFRE
jgi:hypothetical protein